MTGRWAEALAAEVPEASCTYLHPPMCSLASLVGKCKVRSSSQCRLLAVNTSNTLLERSSDFLGEARKVACLVEGAEKVGQALQRRAALGHCEWGASHGETMDWVFKTGFLASSGQRSWLLSCAPSPMYDLSSWTLTEMANCLVGWEGSTRVKSSSSTPARHTCTCRVVRPP